MDADFLLIYKIKNKDEMAGEVFVKKYYSAIFRYSFLHLHHYAEAQDVTQETFLLFFEKIERYRSYGKALNYLYVIARNVCRDYWKKKKPLYLEEMKEEEYDRTFEKVEDGMEQILVKMEIEKAIEKLPEEIRETAILFFFQELKQREIAKILDISLSLVKYRVSRAKQILSDYLREEKR